jgi:CBS domain-containing protein
MTTHEVRRCTVYAGHGEAQILSMEVAPPVEPIRLRTHADRVLLRDIMSKDLVCARPDLDIKEVVGLMIRHHLGCIPVIDQRRRPIGVITKLDLVEQLHATLQSSGSGSPLPQDLAVRNADEAMMPLALVLEEHSTVANAASMMASEDTHHVLVVRAGELVGVVSSKDIVQWLVANDSLTPSASSFVPTPWRPYDG